MSATDLMIQAFKEVPWVAVIFAIGLAYKLVKR